MTLVMSVDLASKMSAYTVQDPLGVLRQGDSWDRGMKTRDQFVRELGQVAHEFRPKVVLIEDIPHGITRLIMVKSVIRLQGRIEQYFTMIGLQRILLWVPPTLWKGHYKLNGKDTAGLIEPKALDMYGYEPPIDLADYKGKLTAAKKIRTDYAAAYLIGRWGLETWEAKGTYDVGNAARSED